MVENISDARLPSHVLKLAAQSAEYSGLRRFHLAGVNIKRGPEKNADISLRSQCQNFHIRIVEHAVNSLYLMYVDNDQNTDNYVDYGTYKAFRQCEDLKSKIEMSYPEVNVPDFEPGMRDHFEQIRSKFDGNPGDKWCADDRLYKRAAKLDKIITDSFANGKWIPHMPSFLMIVNSQWRLGNAFVHGTNLLSEISVKDRHVGLQQASTKDLAEVLKLANWNVLLLLMHIDAKMGAKYSNEIVTSLFQIFERSFAAEK